MTGKMTGKCRTADNSAKSFQLPASGPGIHTVPSILVGSSLHNEHNPYEFSVRSILVLAVHTAYTQSCFMELLHELLKQLPYNLGTAVVSSTPPRHVTAYRACVDRRRAWRHGSDGPRRRGRTRPPPAARADAVGVRGGNGGRRRSSRSD